MTTSLEDPLERGREAFRSRDWREAFDLLSEADSQGGATSNDLEDLGEAAWWLGDLDGAIDVHERAFDAYLEQDDKPRAGYIALTLGRHYFWKGKHSVAMGWKSQGERLINEAEDCVERGWLATTEFSMLREMPGASPDDLLALAEQALDVANRFSDEDLRTVAIQEKALALIAKGSKEEGLKLLDEASVASMTPKIRPLVTGIIYCNTIGACAEMADYRRAGEVTEAATRWCEKQAKAGSFPGICQVHRAEVIRIGGDLAGAEQQALMVVENWTSQPLLVADAMYEIGEIRLRRGDLPAAEEAFEKAFELMRDPNPGLAMVAAAKGDLEGASSALKQALDAEVAPLKRARILPFHVSVSVSSGNLEEAADAVDELTATAANYNTPALQGRALCAQGELQIAEGKASSAIENLKKAAEQYRQADAPYEAARARMHLGYAYQLSGDDRAATREWRAVHKAFQRLGASLDADNVAELLGGETGTATSGTRVKKTFMFTDIVGSTDLVESLGDESWQALLNWHDKTLRSAFTKHSGQVVKSVGDGFFVVFDRVAQAIDCAIAIQRRLRDHRNESGFAPRVRIGLHAAEATQRGLDYEGHGIHVAARIGSLAEGAQIKASLESVQELAFPHSEPETATLKGVGEPVQVVDIDWG